MTVPPPRQGPLQGVRIVEMAGVGPVPFAGMMLADMGAEVLLIEAPGTREARMPLPREQDPLWRGRVSLTLDLKQAPDRNRLLAILAHTDVLLEGFRPGVMERLGAGPEACLQVRPQLIYGRMTGWGQSGPLALKAGHDPNYIALTGALYAMGHADRPPTPPLNIVGDFAGGSMYLLVGVLAGLLAVRNGQPGQVIDASILDGVHSLMTMVHAMRRAGQWSDERGTNLLDGSCPFGSTYTTADGAYMVVCALEPSFYAQFLTGLGLEGATLPGQWDRGGWPTLRRQFETAFARRTQAAWVEAFATLDACVAPVLNSEQSQRHAQNTARQAFIDGLPAPAPRFSATPTVQAPREPESASALLQRWGASTIGNHP